MAFNWKRGSLWERKRKDQTVGYSLPLSAAVKREALPTVSEPPIGEEPSWRERFESLDEAEKR